MIKHRELSQYGYIKTYYELPQQIKSWLLDNDWMSIDQFFLESEQHGGELWIFMKNFVDFDLCEHIIAIREAPSDQEGIWHDDGSRTLGFSLSLNLEPENIQGGELRFRPKGQRDYITFKPLPYGEMVIFLSGLYGYEHQVSQVSKGKRVVIAGWCSS